MAMFDVFSISGSAMNAQSVRLNAIASNLANADSVSGDPNQVYKSKKAVFATMLKNAGNKQSVMGVQVTGIFESKAAPIIRPDSNHPLADAKGNVYMPNINTVEEMAAVAVLLASSAGGGITGALLDVNGGTAL